MDVSTFIGKAVKISASCGAFTLSSSTETDVTNLSVTIISTGRPTMIGVVPDGSVNTAQVAVRSNTATQANATPRFYRGATEIAKLSLNHINSSATNPIQVDYPPAGLFTIDFTPAVGSNTYKLTLACSTTVIANLGYLKLYAFEL